MTASNRARIDYPYYLCSVPRNWTPSSMVCILRPRGSALHVPEQSIWPSPSSRVRVWSRCPWLWPGPAPWCITSIRRGNWRLLRDHRPSVLHVHPRRPNCPRFVSRIPSVFGTLRSKPLRHDRVETFSWRNCEISYRRNVSRSERRIGEVQAFRLWMDAMPVKRSNALSDAQARFMVPILPRSEPRVMAFSRCSGSSYNEQNNIVKSHSFMDVPWQATSWVWLNVSKTQELFYIPPPPSRSHQTGTLSTKYKLHANSFRSKTHLVPFTFNMSKAIRTGKNLTTMNWISSLS